MLTPNKFLAAKRWCSILVNQENVPKTTTPKSNIIKRNSKNSKPATTTPNTTEIILVPSSQDETVLGSPEFMDTSENLDVEVDDFIETNETSLGSIQMNDKNKDTNKNKITNSGQSQLMAFFGNKSAQVKLTTPKDTNNKPNRKRKENPVAKQTDKNLPPKKKQKTTHIPFQLEIITKNTENEKTKSTIIDLDIDNEADDTIQLANKNATKQRRASESVTLSTKKNQQIVNNNNNNQRRKSTGSNYQQTLLGEIKTGQFKVKNNECVVDFEILNPDEFTVTEIGKSKKKKQKGVGAVISQQLNNLLKNIPKSRYDIEFKKMVIPIQNHNELVKKLKQCGVVVHPIPKNVLQIFLSSKKEKEINDETPVDLSGISPQLLQSMYPFQLKGVVFALKKKGRCLLGLVVFYHFTFLHFYIF